MATEIAETALKINLSEILDRAERGEEIMISRANGHTLRLVAADPSMDPVPGHESMDVLIERMHRLRRLNGPVPEDLSAWRHEGHRH